MVRSQSAFTLSHGVISLLSSASLFRYHVTGDDTIFGVEGAHDGCEGDVGIAALECEVRNVRIFNHGED